MNILLLKPLLVLAIALILCGMIASTSPAHHQLNAFIDQAKVQARNEFDAVAARYYAAKTSVERDVKNAAENKVKNEFKNKFITLYGMDVSHYQGDLLNDIGSDKKPLHKLDFFIVKATQGVSDVDPMFSKNWQWLAQNKRRRGAYHFYVSGDDPVQQAQHFIATVGKWQAADIAPVVDIEAAGINPKTTSETLQTDLLRFLHTVEAATQKHPIIYSNTAFAQQWLNKSEFARYPLWLADYTTAAKPVVPDIWQSTGQLIWQKTDQYKVDATQVDFDVFHGKLSQLTGSNHHE